MKINGHPYAHRLCSWVKSFTVTLRMHGAQITAISSTEIFSLLTKFSLVLQTKFL